MASEVSDGSLCFSRRPVAGKSSATNRCLSRLRRDRKRKSPSLAELGDNPLVLDTVAAAYASDGRMEQAVATAHRALSLAERDRHPAVMGVLRDHLSRLEQGEPIRE